MTRDIDLVARLLASANDFERPPSVQSMANIRAINAMREAAATIAELVKALEDIASTFDENWREGCIERMVGDRARDALEKARQP